MTVAYSFYTCPFRENTHLLDEDATPVARREMSERMAEEEKGRDKNGLILAEVKVDKTPVRQGNVSMFFTDTQKMGLKNFQVSKVF